MGLKYKDKYVLLKEIYKSIKNNFYKKISYSLFYSIVKKYFEILIRDLVHRDREFSLPNKMGYVYLDEKPHKRAFHVRVDNEASKEAGKIVKYRIPI